MARTLRFFLSWLWLGATGLVIAADGPALRAVVVYNENEPESKPLATYYAEKRGIPLKNLCGLPIRNAEIITRREFNEQVRAPLLKFLIDHDLLMQLAQETFDNRIDYLILVYGVPLRIDVDSRLKEAGATNWPVLLQRNEASVDSELTALPSPGARITGCLANPFYNSRTPKFAPPLNHVMFLVGRLDGPDPVTVRRMIDDAVATERYGLLGRCYFDGRNTQEAGYIEGDQWIRESNKLLQAAGFESVLDEASELFPEDYPMTDTAIYAGWYAGHVVGPFRRPDFRFRPGAVAYHLHSSSATTLRTQVTYWVGPLLAKGAAASFGNVREPYLAQTPRLDLFFKGLLAGATYAEAGWYSQPSLSWQTTFVGDPLYRPFAVPVDEQIARLEADKKPDVEWAYLRKVNLLLAQGETAEAEKLCRTKATALSSAILAEKLGDLLPSEQRIEPYLTALKNAGDLYRHYRVAGKLAATYEAQAQPALALAVYEELAGKLTAGANAKRIFTKARDLATTLGDADKAKSFQEKLGALEKK